MYKQLFLKLIPKEKSGSADRAVVPAEDLGIQFWDHIYYSRNQMIMQHFFLPSSVTDYLVVVR